MAEVVDLPVRWRPFGPRIAGALFGGLLLVVCIAAWMSFGAEIQATFDWGQRIFMLAFGAMIAVVFHALMRSRVDADASGLQITNGYRTRDFGWADVVSVTLPPGAPWATLDLADGTSVSAMGIQGSDGTRARAAVRELRALLEHFHAPQD